MNKGFTLIELLIVVAIIAILAAIAVPNFLEAQTRAKVSRVKADQRTAATALESYAVDNNRYPPHWIMPPALNLRAVQQTDILPWPARAGVDADQSLPRLTTPVSYLTSIELMRDVFIANTKRVSVGGDVEIDADYFVYQMFGTFSFDYGSDSNNAPVSFEGWSLTSAGPDKQDDATGWRMYNYYKHQQGFGSFSSEEEAQAHALQGIYDPTNGTISDGDITRFGGAVPGLAGEITSAQ